MCQQTKAKKPRKCLPGSTSAGRQNQRKQENVCRARLVSADKSKESKKMSAGHNLCRQTKAKKARKCLPGPTDVGRQNQRKQKNVCRVQLLPADISKKHIKRAYRETYYERRGCALCAAPLMSRDQNSVSLSRLCSYSVCSLRLTLSRISWIFSVEVDILVRDRSWFIKSMMVAIYLLISALA